MQSAITDSTTKRIKSKKDSPRKSWINDNVLDAMAKRDKLFHNTKTQPLNYELKQQYKIARNRVIALIKKAKNEHYKNRICNISKNPKEAWRIIKAVCGKNTRKKSQYPIVMSNPQNHSILDSEMSIANEFNMYYRNIGPKLVEKKPIDYKNFKFKQLPNTMYLEEISIEEINKYLLALDINKATGPDNISSRCLKDLKELVSEPLTKIFNNCYNKGYCPTAFTSAYIIPIYKKDKRNLICNYRPISIISSLAKIFEKCLFVRMNKYLKSINFFLIYNLDLEQADQLKMQYQMSLHMLKML